ncbi:MAG: toll/interleukin-1 receptor domain-containing protein, partial [Anaerolineae bacterium]|nr:toll/interleukin-1 receptor domain-containing protein [Anaerolineae bacterium]
MYKQHVFLSYSRKDQVIRDAVCEILKKDFIKVWFDKEVKLGSESWRKDVENAIDAAGCLVVIFTPNAKQSTWVGLELDYARKQEIPIFGILADGDDSTSIPFGYTEIQYSDIRTGEKDEKLAGLVEEIINRKLVIKSLPYLVPLQQWVCDTCGQIIEEPSHGYLCWLREIPPQ